MYQLTRNRKYMLRVDLEDFQGNKVFAHYSSFSVGPEADGYELHVSGFTDGGAGRTLSIIHIVGCNALPHIAIVIWPSSGPNMQLHLAHMQQRITALVWPRCSSSMYSYSDRSVSKFYSMHSKFRCKVGNNIKSSMHSKLNRLS